MEARLTRHRRGTVYLLVLLVSMLVAIIAIGGATLRREMLGDETLRADLVHARASARSGLELGLHRLSGGEGIWRIGDPTASLAELVIGSGTVTAELIDPRTGAAVSSTDLTGVASLVLVGRASWGGATCRLGIDLDLQTHSLHEQAMKHGPSWYWPMNDPAGQTKATEVIAGTTGAYGTTDEPAMTEGPDGRLAPTFARASHGMAVRLPVRSADEEATVCFWVRPESSTGSRLVLAKAGSSAANVGDFGIAMVDGVLWVHHVDSSGVTAARGPTLEAGRWAHIAYVVESRQTTLYVNGSKTAETKGSFVSTSSGAEYLRVGGPLGSGLFGYTLPLDGSIYGLGFFSRALQNSSVRDMVPDPDTYSPVIVDAGSVRWIID